MKCKLLLAICCMVMGAATAKADLDLGKAVGIYTAPDASDFEKQAAKILVEKLNLMCATKLADNPAAPAYAATLENALFVGKKAAIESGLITAEELEKYKYDGFVVRVKGNRLAIAGYLGRGSIYGAYAFLEKLGYRFYMWDVQTIPNLADKVVKDFTLCEKPALEFRTGTSWEERASCSDIGDPHNGANPELFGPDVTLWIDHTSYYLVPPPLYSAEHPEYYSLQPNGSRVPTSKRADYTHLCLSNPDVVRISTERVLAWIKKSPNQRFFFVTQGDGHDWCTCPNCKAMDVVPGNYSDRLLKWMNPIARAVAKEFPDVRVMGLAYCGPDFGPIKEKPEKNIIMLYAPYWGVGLSEAHPLTNEFNSEALKLLESWYKAAPDNIGVYDYNMYFSPSWDAMAEKVKWAAGKGMKGFFHCGQPSCFRQLFGFMTHKLEWNPDQDPEKLKKEFVDAVYGPAAPHIMEYLTFVRERLMQGYPRGIHDGAMPADYYEPAAFKKMLACFDQAAAAATNDTRIKNLITAEREMMMSDYRASVNFRTIKLSPEARALAITYFQEYLTKQVALLEAAKKELANDKVDAKSKEIWQKKFDDGSASLRGMIAYFANLDAPAAVDTLALAAECQKDIEATSKKYPIKSIKTEAEKIANGIKLAATVFEGGGYGPADYSWFCPNKMAIGVYTPNSPRGAKMKAAFTLAEAPAGAATLDIEGQDSQNDALPVAQIEIIINGKSIHKGDCGFVKRGWSRKEFAIEAGLLKKGENVLEINNIYQDTKRMDGWWFMISEAVIKFGK